VKFLNIDIIAFQELLTGREQTADGEVVKEHHGDGVLRRHVDMQQ
jgi:hypothetical protein